MAAHQEKLSSKSFKWFSIKTLKLNRSFRKQGRSSPESSSSSSLNSPRSNTDHYINNTKSHHSDVELRRVFSHFDVNSDGKISAFELRDYFGSVGENITHEAAQEAINEVDTDADGSLGFDDFVGLMTRRDFDGNDDGGGELKTAFEMFEVEKGAGCITPKGLQNMLAKLGELRTYGECEAMISYYDNDGNGVLDYHEFRQMMAV